MNIETLGWGPLVIIFVMALVTLATRWGGVYIMSFVPINHRVKQFIAAMSSSVLVALIAPLALEGDIGARIALFTTAILMIIFKKPLPAIAAGILAAAIFRNI